MEPPFTMVAVAGEGNILIVDESALHALLHDEWGRRIEQNRTFADPLRNCASRIDSLRAFNIHHPLYGPPPVSLLVSSRGDRRASDDIICRQTQLKLPPGSFFKLRENLYMATPEFVYVRMACQATEAQLAEIGMNLCGSFFINAETGEMPKRATPLTTPDKLKAFAESASYLRGSKKAIHALRRVLPNSRSPLETKMKLIFSDPLSLGGLGLPFDSMNLDVFPHRARRIMSQDYYCVDMADSTRKIAMEYDGEEGHLDASTDKQRRNELAALGWTVFPIDKEVLYDPEATIRTAEQVAKAMKVRLRFSSQWPVKYRRLREELRL